MKKLITVLSALSLAACTIGQPTPLIPAPVELAQRTKADEQVGVGVELAYKGFRTALELGVDAGALKGARAATAAKADQRAYAGLVAFRNAYKTANSNDLAETARNANAAIDQALATIKGK